jgi:hypothetical protein
MYKWKRAKRSETNNLFTSLLEQQVNQRAAHVTSLAIDRFGSWYKIQLPAGVVALMVRNDNDTTVGYYHVGYEADLEYENRSQNATKKTA